MKESSINIQKAMEIAEIKAKEIEKYILKLVKGETEEALLILKEKLSLRNKDGGFPFRFRKGEISTIGATIMFYKDLIMLNLQDAVKDELEQAINFIISNQSDKGYWEEPEGISKLDCAAWESRGFESNQIYCTAISLNFLIGSKNKTAETAIRKGIEYLEKKWSDETGFRSYPHALWNAVPSIFNQRGKDSPIAKRGLEMLNTIQLQNYPASSLAWMMESFIHAGLEKHPFVEKLLEALIPKQNSSGLWISEDGEDFDATTTLTILVILKRLGKL